MANTNCLEGMACPLCGSEGPFRIVTTCWALVSDDGIHEDFDHEWEADSSCICRECDFTGCVNDFRVKEPT